MKILVVEDDVKIAKALARGLAAEDFASDVAHNGDDGVWMATESQYDLIILDVMLPARDGFQVCSDLRSIGNWTPIVMLTARDEDDAEMRGLEAGADAYVTKPFSFPVLVAHIRSTLRRSVRCTTAPLAVGSLQIDTVSRRAWSSGTEIELTHREFDVLEFLMRRSGKSVSKETILRGVWDFDFDGSDNIVQVYVTRLRRKLDGPYGTEHFRTVYGVGYRLEGDVA
jgi:DNA-binding response OmpR family regulator